MKPTKILLTITIILLLTGTAYAIDINNLKMPNNWEPTGNGNYHEIGDSTGSGSGRNMMIQPMTDSVKEDFFSNVSEDNYFVFSNGDNTFNFSDGSAQDSGCFEVVSIEGKDYFVLFSTLNSVEFDKDTKSTYDLMVEFNKLNNLKPIAV